MSIVVLGICCFYSCIVALHAEGGESLKNDIIWKTVYKRDRFREVLPPLYHLILDPEQEMCFHMYVRQSTAILSAFADNTNESSTVVVRLEDPNNHVINTAVGHSARIDQQEVNETGEYTFCVTNPSNQQRLKTVVGMMNLGKDNDIIHPEEIVNHLKTHPVIKTLMVPLWETTRLILEVMMAVDHFGVLIDAATVQMTSINERIVLYMKVWTVFYLVLLVARTLAYRKIIIRIIELTTKSTVSQA